MSTHNNDLTIPDETLVFNGLNGATGDYLLPPMTPTDLAQFIGGEKDKDFLEDLKAKAALGPFPVAEGIDETDLSQTGWGVIFPAEADPKSVAAIKEALSDLFHLREKQAGPYFKIFEGPDGYRQSDTKRAFLRRFGVGSADVVDPEKGVPYYLLLVGSPAEIPYRFQYELDVQFAVGRISFETLHEYANYAANVVAVEKGEVKLPRKACFFGTANRGDRATRMSSERLIAPLYEDLKEDYPDWEMKSFVGEKAYKTNLEALLGGNETPALLFTASHGMWLPQKDSRYPHHQGALVCQEWGRSHRGAIPPEYYFAGDDLKSEDSLLGAVAFFFACFGAGTPKYDSFYKKMRQARKFIADEAFLSQLPVKMLGRPNGALAAVGHVDIAWSYAFISEGYQNTTTFKSALEGVLLGHPIGFAFEDFNLRYAALATELTEFTQEVEYRQKRHPGELEQYLVKHSSEMIELWTEHNDARNYIILGDPAARLSLADE